MYNYVRLMLFTAPEINLHNLHFICTLIALYYTKLNENARNKRASEISHSHIVLAMLYMRSPLNASKTGYKPFIQRNSRHFY